MRKIMKRIMKAIANLQIQPNTYHKFSIVIALLNTVLAIVKLFN